MPQDKGPLKTIREALIGEMRHRIVMRYRDGSYWYVRQFRDDMGRWIPMKVENQSGRIMDAERRFFEATT